MRAIYWVSLSILLSACGGSGGVPPMENTDKASSAAEQTETPQWTSMSRYGYSSNPDQVRIQSNNINEWFFQNLEYLYPDASGDSGYLVNRSLSHFYPFTGTDTKADLVASTSFDFEEPEFYPLLNDLDISLNDNLGLTLSSRMFVNEKYPLRDAFLERAVGYFDTDISLVEMSTFDLSAEAKAWYEGVVGAMALIDEKFEVEQSTEIYLLNAMHYQTAWQQPFNEQDTDVGLFNLFGGIPADAAYMQGTFEGELFQGDDLTVVKIPGAEDGVSFYIWHPDAEDTQQLQASFDSAKVASVLSQLSVADVSLSVPRFSDFSSYNGTALVGDEISDDVSADLYGLNVIGDNDLYMSEFLVRAALEFTESGVVMEGLVKNALKLKPVPEFQSGDGSYGLHTETIVLQPDFNIISSQPIHVGVNSPFIVFLMDDETQTLLYANYVTAPLVE